MISNNTIATHTPNNTNPIIQAIHHASKESGVDFSYLLNQAKAESSLNPAAKAKTSSATGLYQFIDSTWMDMINKYGDDYGLNVEGKSRAEILNMRKDPKASSFMAAAFASENERVLNKHWGGDVGATELYFAHFLGASGASAFLNARDENPLTPAADLFPRAARANRNVFYDRDTGKARSLEEVYAFFDKKFQDKSQEQSIAIANAPRPPEMPIRKLANAHNSAFDRTAINKDSIIMQRAQAMRDMSEANRPETIHAAGHIAGYDVARDNPLLSRSVVQTKPAAAPSLPPSLQSMIARPLDVMLLTQTIPNQVVRDIS